VKRTVRAVVALVIAGGLFAGCSAEGGIDTSGDGVKIEGDVDAKDPE
jgi:outer membrane murein-binding lipoprotein Lpp